MEEENGGDVYTSFSVTNPETKKEINWLARQIIDSIKSSIFEKMSEKSNHGDYFFVCPILIGKANQHPEHLSKQGMSVFTFEYGGSALCLDNKYGHVKTQTSVMFEINNILHTLLGKNMLIPSKERVDYQLIQLGAEVSKEQHLRMKATQEREELRKQFEQLQRTISENNGKYEIELKRVGELLDSKSKEAEHFKMLYSKVKEDSK